MINDCCSAAVGFPGEGRLGWSRTCESRYAPMSCPEESNGANQKKTPVILLLFVVEGDRQKQGARRPLIN